MDIKLVDISGSDEVRKIKELYFKAFPQNERIPFWFLLWKSKLSFVRFCNIYDGDNWVGFIYLIDHSKLMFILFFAIDEKFRSNGFGTEVIKIVKNLYSEKKIMLSIEKIDESAENNDIRIRRKDFYIRNGFTETDYNFLNMPFQPLFYGDNFNPNEYYTLTKCYAGAAVWYLLRLSKYIKLEPDKKT